MSILGICAAITALKTMMTFLVVMRINKPDTPEQQELFY
jgi:hypothetical protein